ncbi:MAG: class I SAM-dependent methyltransferase family protein [Candidatus Nezhaarchaeota archaeon]|nr:class I SAM-dependent methyltransferase family protein [Candidatus Nezhaarchaeota archaeon]
MARRNSPLVRAALRTCPLGLAKRVVKSFDVVGDIAVIKVPPELVEHRHSLAKALLEELPHVKAVFRQSSPHVGDYRLRGLEWLAGEHRTVTIHREHGCYFKVDLAKAYFTPRLSYERLRVASLASEGELVFNMFAGVGCFSILLAKLRGAEVVSVDLNADAAKLMAENVELNRVRGLVHVVRGDSKLLGLVGKPGWADRVLMPLPLKSLEFLDAAVHVSKLRGVIHFYGEARGSRTEALRKVWLSVERRARELGAKVCLLNSRVVREVGPRVFQVAIDLRLEGKAGF